MFKNLAYIFKYKWKKLGSGAFKGRINCFTSFS